MMTTLSLDGLIIGLLFLLMVVKIVEWCGRRYEMDNMVSESKQSIKNNVLWAIHNKKYPNETNQEEDKLTFEDLMEEEAIKEYFKNEK